MKSSESAQKPSYSSNLKILRYIAKHPEQYSKAELERIYNITNQWIAEMPDVLSNGLFTADRKMTLAGVNNKIGMAMAFGLHKQEVPQ